MQNTYLDIFNILGVRVDLKKRPKIFLIQNILKFWIKITFLGFTQCNECSRNYRQIGSSQFKTAKMAYTGALLLKSVKIS